MFSVSESTHILVGVRVQPLKITHVFRIGPKKVSRAGGGFAIIYLPKSLSWLQGKQVFLTIEVIEEK